MTEDSSLLGSDAMFTDFLEQHADFIYRVPQSMKSAPLETSVTINQLTSHHIPQDFNQHQ
jgi:hypothetical protein